MNGTFRRTVGERASGCKAELGRKKGSETEDKERSLVKPKREELFRGFGSPIAIIKLVVVMEPNHVVKVLKGEEAVQRIPSGA